MRYKLAKHLKTDPAMIYVEVHSADGLRVVPFEYMLNERYTKQYTEEAGYRTPPEQYSQQSDKVFRIGPLVISRAFSKIAKHSPRLTPQKAV